MKLSIEDRQKLTSGLKLLDQLIWESNWRKDREIDNSGCTCAEYYKREHQKNEDLLQSRLSLKDEISDILAGMGVEYDE